ncbi:hypothetical protein AERO8C_120532 [Aeromonas veronii]|uniref:Uncharacterized protein n=1 Tax=Aeromonas veronii TaxID=654 RepID=A0A653KRW8_AERVE|nr:hypothetical protein AERO8C_120532 [Aeromonas veronii]
MARYIQFLCLRVFFTFFDIYHFFFRAFCFRGERGVKTKQCAKNTPNYITNFTFSCVANKRKELAN